MKKKDPAARLIESADAALAALGQLPGVEVKKPFTVTPQLLAAVQHGPVAFVAGNAGQATLLVKKHRRTGHLKVITAGRTRTVRRVKMQVRREVLQRRAPQPRTIECPRRVPQRTARGRASRRSTARSGSRGDPGSTGDDPPEPLAAAVGRVADSGSYTAREYFEAAALLEQRGEWIGGSR